MDKNVALAYANGIATYRSTNPAPQLFGLRSRQQLFFLMLLETLSQELYNLKTLLRTRALAKPPEVCFRKRKNTKGQTKTKVPCHNLNRIN